MIMSYILLFLLFSKSGAVDFQDCHKTEHHSTVCNYMDTFGKIYSNHTELNLRAKRISAITSSTINGVQFGHTSRSDRFKHELKRNNMLKSRPVSRPYSQKHVQYMASSHLPPIDWRNVDGISYVTSVKNQGDCGGCFAFAATTVLEYWSKKHGNPKSLSVQHVLDCTSTTEGPNDGCDGGLMEYIFQYGTDYAIQLDFERPYTATGQSCPDTHLLSHVRVGKWKVLEHDIIATAEEELEFILHAYGPVAVGVDSSEWDNYRGGVFRHTMCTHDIDHAVTIVGYTDTAWIIKNSWGDNWGDEGYMYLERGHNACGVAEYMVYVAQAYPVLTSRPSKVDWQLRP